MEKIEVQDARVQTMIRFTPAGIRWLAARPEDSFNPRTVATYTMITLVANRVVTLPDGVDIEDRLSELMGVSADDIEEDLNLLENVAGLLIISENGHLGIN